MSLTIFNVGKGELVIVGPFFIKLILYMLHTALSVLQRARSTKKTTAIARFEMHFA